MEGEGPAAPGCSMAGCAGATERACPSNSSNRHQKVSPHRARGCSSPHGPDLGGRWLLYVALAFTPSRNTKGMNVPGRRQDGANLEFYEPLLSCCSLGLPAARKSVSVAYTAIPSGHGEINGATGEPGRGRRHKATPRACEERRNLRKASLS